MTCTQPRYGSKSSVGSVSTSVASRFVGSLSSCAFSLTLTAPRSPEGRRRLAVCSSFSISSAASCSCAFSAAADAASSARRATSAACVGAPPKPPGARWSGARRSGRGTTMGRCHQIGSSAAAMRDERPGARCTAGWSTRSARQLCSSSQSSESEGTETSSGGCEHAACQKEQASSEASGVSYMTSASTAAMGARMAALIAFLCS
mmetsp:Transcript_48795/g.117562  ORF Transcript_48795/g.117562 Transcript_48795/m.117562 type:complete len:205 (+) Transcript_48795:734-1348(+)